MSIIVVCPDPYGRFGHQTNSILAGVYFAELLGWKLLLPRYKYFADHWNTCVDWSQCPIVCDRRSIAAEVQSLSDIIYLESEDADGYGNRKYDLSDIGTYGEFLDSLSRYADRNALVFFPFDQQLASRQYKHLFRPALRSKLENIITSSSVKEHVSCKGRLFCIHIRRGDVSPVRHPQNYVPDSFYCRLIEMIAPTLGRMDVLVVLVQGHFSLNRTQSVVCLENSNRLRIICETEEFHNQTDCDAFRLMSYSDILFASDSSFPRLAALFGTVDRVVNISRAPFQFFPLQYDINPDGEIDLNRFRSFLQLDS